MILRMKNIFIFIPLFCNISMGVTIPRWAVSYELSSSAAISLSPLSAFICIFCTVILLFGIKDSSRFNLIITAINLLIIFFVIALGCFHINSANYSPFFPYGVQGTWAGVATVFFSYIGFDSVTTLAGEVKNPGRALPLGELVHGRNEGNQTASFDTHSHPLPFGRKFLVDQ